VADKQKLQAEAIPTPDGLDPGVVISTDTRRENRLPPNQARTKKWPILDASGPPGVDRESWRFEIQGLVDVPMSLGWQDLQVLPRTKVFADMHCVTRWSRLGNLWEGVATRELLSRAKVSPLARFVLVHAYDNDYTTNVPLEYLLTEDALLADTHDGEPLSAEHGGPVRLVVPRLYAWKSAKWAKGLEVLSEDRAGLWENGGYHMRGDPWKEERFRTD
jgi:DMSO/TMAO reductase YedYZ molybdopterin-dependent catalytic subunit